jgi:hypothetical protein
MNHPRKFEEFKFVFKNYSSCNKMGTYKIIIFNNIKKKKISYVVYYRWRKIYLCEVKKWYKSYL